MYEQKIFVENIKCGGCENSIKKKLQQLIPSSSIDINNETGEICILSKNEVDVEIIIKTLHQMGYPVSGRGTNLTTAKSYVSCMIGRLSNSSDN